MLAHEDGILSATTAFGKTVVAAWLVAARKVNTLVLVHRRQLLDQWRERLATFLNLPIKSIGQIRGGRRRAGGIIDVAVSRSAHHTQNNLSSIAQVNQTGKVLTPQSRKNLKR